MRHFVGALAIFLIASGISFAQVPADWDQWLKDGLAAEEDSEYKEAARLLSQACDPSAAASLGSERLFQACSALVRAYLTDRKPSEAVEMTEKLVAAMDELPNARQVDRVRSSILLAHGHAYRGDFERTNSALTTAVEQVKGLELIEGVLAYTEISTFYLPTSGKAFGDTLLDAAIQTIARHPTKSGDEFIDAVKKLVAVLDDDADRISRVVDLLTPIIAKVQELSFAQPGFSDEWREYDALSRKLESTHKDMGEADAADRLEKARKMWPQPAASEKSEISQARRTRRADPLYPRIAKSARIRGTVTLSVEISVEGEVRNIQVTRPIPFGLTEEAIRAVRQWRYQPLLINGVPTPIATEINVVFQL